MIALRRPSASAAASEIIELNARLRLACAAIGCRPEDVRVRDVCASEQHRLRQEGTEAFWTWINTGASP